MQRLVETACGAGKEGTRWGGVLVKKGERMKSERGKDVVGGGLGKNVYEEKES